MSATQRIAVLGAGAWGTAIATMLAAAGTPTVLWGRNAEALDEISSHHVNSRYLPGIPLQKTLEVEVDLSRALAHSNLILLVTPAQTVSELTKMLAPHATPGATIVCCAKGIDRNSGELPAEIILKHLPENPPAALSGPSFAVDVARGLPTAVTVAAGDLDSANRLAQQLSTSTFRCYASDDLKGVELGGALKNVLALAVGVTRGMKLGASAEAALIARGFAEMSRLATALGARPATLTGLSGLGDLVLTCSNVQSRNFAYGIALAGGAPLDGLPLAEGVFTARIAARLARENDVSAPVTETVAAVLDGDMSAMDAVTALLSRPLKSE
ncbi:MAG: NAD(P)H-dependent glycerol-3-phosphate dehydrogenase [Rhizobiaceae bacterium]